MKIGAHVSIAGGIQNAPKNAKSLGAECFQMFSRSPRGGGYGVPSEESVTAFLQQCKVHGFEVGKDYVIHSPYYINLSSKNNRIYYGSINAIKAELKTASLIKCPYVITHIGSSKDLDGQDVQAQLSELVLKAIRKIHEDYTGSARLLLEIAAGSGNIIGDTFEEIGYFIEEAKKLDIKLGFCFDSCHAFAAGYDLRTKEAVRKTFERMDRLIGLKNLKVVHFNDSKTAFDSHKDLHEHIGQGEIGMEGMKEVYTHAQLLDVPLIIETEHGKVKEDIKLVKQF